MCVCLRLQSFESNKGRWLIHPHNYDFVLLWRSMFAHNNFCTWGLYIDSTTENILYINFLNIFSYTEAQLALFSVEDGLVTKCDSVCVCCRHVAVLAGHFGCIDTERLVLIRGQRPLTESLSLYLYKWLGPIITRFQLPNSVIIGPEENQVQLANYNSFSNGQDDDVAPRAQCYKQIKANPMLIMLVEHCCRTTFDFTEFSTPCSLIMSKQSWFRKNHVCLVCFKFNWLPWNNFWK